MLQVLWAQPNSAHRGHRTPVASESLRSIIEQVARKYDLTVAELTGAQRSRRIAWPRQEVMWRASKETKASLPQIGLALGSRDHTTILHGIRAHAKRIRQRIGE